MDTYQFLDSMVSSLPLILNVDHRLLQTNLSQLPVSESYRLEQSLNANRDIIKKIATKLPNHIRVSSTDIISIMNGANPGNGFLSLLGIQKCTLADLIQAMQAAEYWTGLSFYHSPMAPMILEGLPKQVEIFPGEPLKLSVKAAGIPAPSYQWFYFPPNYDKAKPIHGQNSSTLFLQNADWLASLTVCCSICNDQGKQFLSCVIDVRSYGNPSFAGHRIDPIRPVAGPGYASNLPPEKPIQNPRFTAKDKVALLIGNGMYMSERKLKAPPNDIKKIGAKLQKMKFKTLICKDLNYVNMWNVINYFTELLMEGVYGVLYFAGHGFGVRGVCYMVPSDSPTSPDVKTCISYKEVVNQILQKKPALCLVMLDVCRVSQADQDVEELPTQSNNSTMVVYATSEGKKAYEVKSQDPLSIFAKHLLKYISEPIPVKQLIINKVIESMGKDDLAKANCQIPEVKVTLATDRSLHDSIDFKGSTVAFQRNMMEWSKVNDNPERRAERLTAEGVDVVITFDHEYSNVLYLYTACIKKRHDIHAMGARVIRVQPETVSGISHHLAKNGWPNEFRVNPDCLSVYKSEISGLESLDEDLVVTVSLTGVTQSERSISTEFTVNLKRPLLACLNHGPNRKRGRNVPLREPIQHEENSASENDESVAYQNLQQGIPSPATAAALSMPVISNDSSINVEHTRRQFQTLSHQ